VRKTLPVPINNGSTNQMAAPIKWQHQSNASTNQMPAPIKTAHAPRGHTLPHSHSVVLGFNGVCQ
jgi:hypothetical protein